MLNIIDLPALTASLLMLSGAVTALDPNCHPGGNFDLSKWNLQLPIANSGSGGFAATIPSSQLQGCGGYTSQYFETGTDGRLVMKVPGAPPTCVTTSTNSVHCRTELREQSPATWSSNAGTNRLNVRMAVKALKDNQEIAISQILQTSTINRPVAEVYYRSNGNIQVGVSQTLEGGSQQRDTHTWTVEPQKFFDLELRLENNKLFFGINGDVRQLTGYKLNPPPCYFKTGNYNQGDGATEVHFLSINVAH